MKNLRSLMNTAENIECVNNSRSKQKKLCFWQDNDLSRRKGYQRMRNGNRRGYLVVELEATEINSRRMMVSADMPF